MQTQIQEQVDKYRITDNSELDLIAEPKKGRRRCKTQHYQVKAAVQREHEARQRLDKTQRECEALETHSQNHKAEILELEATKFEDDNTISELRKELHAARKEVRSSHQQQQKKQQSPASKKGVTRASKRKATKGNLKNMRAQRDAIREELDGVRDELSVVREELDGVREELAGVRKERMKELEEIVEREEPYLLGVFELMRRQIDDLQKKNNSLVARIAA